MAADALLPTAQVLGITSSAVLAGLIGAMSLVSIPSLAELPAPLAAKVWRRTYEIGVRTAPPLAIGCAGAFGFLASQCKGVVPCRLDFEAAADRGQREGYRAASLPKS